MGRARLGSDGHRHLLSSLRSRGFVRQSLGEREGPSADLWFRLETLRQDTVNSIKCPPAQKGSGRDTNEEEEEEGLGQALKGGETEGTFQAGG